MYYFAPKALYNLQMRSHGQTDGMMLLRRGENNLYNHHLGSQTEGMMLLRKGNQSQKNVKS